MKIPNTNPFYRLPVFRVLQAQFLVMVLLSAGVFFLSGKVAGYSALFGGAIPLIANVYFAHKTFRYFGARSTPAIVRSIWVGEAGKQFLTAALFALVFVGVQPLSVAALFGGYVLVLGTGASALLLMKSNPKHKI